MSIPTTEPKPKTEHTGQDARLFGTIQRTLSTTRTNCEKFQKLANVEKKIRVLMVLMIQMNALKEEQKVFEA